MPGHIKRRSAIARELGLSATGGHSLGMVSDLIDQSLRSFHTAAVEQHGPEDGAVLLALLLLRDPGYVPREWVGEALRPHKRAVVAAFASRDDEPEMRLKLSRDRARVGE